MNYSVIHSWRDMAIISFLLSLPSIGSALFGDIGLYVGQGIVFIILIIVSTMVVKSIWEMTKDWMTEWDILAILTNTQFNILAGGL